MEKKTSQGNTSIKECLHTKHGGDVGGDRVHAAADGPEGDTINVRNGVSRVQVVVLLTMDGSLFL